MKSIKILIAAVLTGTLATAFTLTARNTDTPADKGFAVVELFTSEGCSSCPPADALIAKVQKESAGKPVYILAFHVDYWNHLGWKDQFSDAAYTGRQKQYARWFSSDQLYTPQAIVNGRSEFVGSEEGAMRNALKNSLQKTAKTEVSLKDVKAAGDKISLQYNAAGETSSTSLVVALVEKNAVSKVERGENGGRTLSHVQIVRKLQTVNIAGHTSGTVNITAPSGFNAEGWEVIALAQNTSTGEITGATRGEFNGAISAGTK